MILRKIHAKRKQAGIAKATIDDDLKPSAATTMVTTKIKAAKVFPTISLISSTQYCVLSSVITMSISGGRISSDLEIIL